MSKKAKKTTSDPNPFGWRYGRPRSHAQASECQFLDVQVFLSHKEVEVKQPAGSSLALPGTQEAIAPKTIPVLNLPILTLACRSPHFIASIQSAYVGRFPKEALAQLNVLPTNLEVCSMCPIWQKRTLWPQPPVPPPADPTPDPAITQPSA